MQGGRPKELFPPNLTQPGRYYRHSQRSFVMPEKVAKGFESPASGPDIVGTKEHQGKVVPGPALGCLIQSLAPVRRGGLPDGRTVPGSIVIRQIQIPYNSGGTLLQIVALLFPGRQDW